MFYPQFKDKKIAVIGCSIEGISSIDFLYGKAAELTLCDQKDETQFDNEFLKRIKKNDIGLKLGKDYLEGLEKFDLIVRTPGFPLWHPKLKQAINKGITVTSQTKIFFDLCPGKIIGVTGTKGKGTTSTLIYKLVKNSHKKVFLGGNIGTAPLSFLENVDKDTWVVLELSSFQLSDLTKSPHIAVVLNITSDHLYSASFESPNYHLSYEDYIKAKINILKFQKRDDFAVLNKDYPSSSGLAKFTIGDCWFFSKEKELKKGSFVKENKIYLAHQDKLDEIISINKIQLRGRHNLENITAAITAAFLAGVNPKKMGDNISKFKGLEHRLEFVRLYKKRYFYNDSFSTTPETTIAAIKSFTEQDIILICGGSEKNSDYTELGKEIIKGRVKKVILIGSTALRIEKSIKNALKDKAVKKSLIIIQADFKDMRQIVEIAFRNSNKGDVILLSPASASFDMFKNYKERGLLFKRMVRELKS